MHRAWSTYLEHHRGGSGNSQSMEGGIRPSSVASAANSTYSQATSTRHLMQPLEPPNAPFAASTGSSTSLNQNSSPLLRDNSSPVSLSVNYLPSKFSSNLHARKRKGGKGDDDGMLPKRGGGREAFRSGEARMPGDGDDDYDGLQGPLFGGKKKKRWNRFKWTLFVSNILLTGYSLVALIFCLLTWFDVWKHADVVRVGNKAELIISTLAASLGVVTSMVGWSGILLNNRSFLAVYTFMLWLCFAGLVTPGYITYKRRTFNLEGKVNAQWSRDLGPEGRLRIQNQLQCCGYFSPFVEATISQTCYARSILPGCKKSYLNFERLVLGRWYIVAFGIVPLHIAIMVVGLLCSNHVTYRFGKGMMPKAYRLSMNSMAVIMENYAQQLAEQYGNDVASEVLARSRSNLNLATMPSMGYAQPPGMGSATGSYTSSTKDGYAPPGDSYNSSRQHQY